MYDELVKVLRGCVLSKPCEGCPYYDPHGPTEKCATLNIAAADAIEGLSREAEEYKAAYREEHNKRIAENRYLYDELTKAVREKLLMTPMRIEVPEPPKEA